MQKIPENVLSIAKVTLPLLVIIVLFIILGQFGFGKISQIQNQISTAENENKVLTQKLDILRNVSEIGEAGADSVVAALPESNPSLFVWSQLKNLASTEGVTISELKASNPNIGTTGPSSANILFTLSGTRDQIKSFLGKISMFAPIAVVDKIKIAESAPGASTATITVKSFWAPFPLKIPAISDPITALTSEEQQTLQEVSNLIQPTINIVPAVGGGKVDPFSI